MSKIWQSYNEEEIAGSYLYNLLSIPNLNKLLKTGSNWFALADKFGNEMVKQIEK